LPEGISGNACGTSVVSSGTSHATGYDIQMSGRFVPAIEGMSEVSQKMHAKRVGACK
jgi:hypothetical protein